VSKDISVIPQGFYCYDDKGVCPYWSRRDEGGYCAYLEKGDWQIEGGLLWDQVKECGIDDEFIE
jgi:hypothetical protein